MNQTTSMVNVLMDRPRLWAIKKVLRTMQSNFSFLKEAKDKYYLFQTRHLRYPSEPFFRALPLIARRLHGEYIDVGANIGQSIESIRLYVPDARIVAFEPNPNLFRKLCHRYRADTRIDIRDVGLSDASHSVDLFVPSYRGFVYDGLGSLDCQSASTWLSRDTLYFFDPKRLKVDKYACRIETLDMQRLDQPIFIKIDVEGTEYGVIKGGIETLRKHQPVLLVEGWDVKGELQSLSGSLGYAPYMFDGKRFTPGPSPTSSFLMTPARASVLCD